MRVATERPSSSGSQDSLPAVIWSETAQQAHWAATLIAGLPLLLRQVFDLGRAGVSRVLLIGAPLAETWRRISPTSGRTPIPVETYKAFAEVTGRLGELDAEQCCWLRCDLFLQPEALKTLIQAARDREGSLALVTPGARLPACIGGRELPRDPGELIRVAPCGGFVLAGPKDLRGAEELLFESIAPSSDSPGLDRLLHRRLSRLVSRGLLRTPITPNQVTILALLVGLGGVWALTRGDWLGGAVGFVCYLLFCILDCVDGEIARLKFLASRFGDLWDITVDNLVRGGLIAAMGWGMGVQSADGDLVWLGGIGGLGVFLDGWVVYAALEGRGRARGEPGQRSVIPAQVISNQDIMYGVILLYMILLEVGRWAALFLGGIAAGAHLFWMLLLARLFWSRRVAAAWRTE
ncbi:MAG: CDP-alcohol phosphatidyltransferase family protein [Candidatus Methylomirabilales bacterium]